MRCLTCICILWCNTSFLLLLLLLLFITHLCKFMSWAMGTLRVRVFRERTSVCGAVYFLTRVLVKLTVFKLKQTLILSLALR